MTRAPLLVALLVAAACGAPASSPPDARSIRPDAAGTGADASPSPDASAAPDGAAAWDASPSPSPDGGGAGPVWFLHLTDTHLGENTGPAPGNLQAFVRDVLPVVQPALTVHTGDLTDTGDPLQYDAYSSLVTGKVAAFPLYSEIPGNHDVKTDTTADFLARTPTGKAGGKVWGVHDVDTSSGRVRLVRTSTVDSGLGTLRMLGVVGDGQVSELLSAPTSAVPLRGTLLAAHHPFAALSSTSSDSRMQQLIDHFAPAFYLCGHVHLDSFSWLGKTFVQQAATLGRENGSEGHFVLGALDDDGPAARSVPIDYALSPTVAWPLVLVTRPGDAKLGGTNPVAKAVKAGATMVVRSLAFAPSAVTSVRVRVDSGAWSSMTNTGPSWWTATVSAPASSGSHTVEVSATSGEGAGAGAVTISVVP